MVAEATPLQTNTGQVAKTIESKQIQDLMLNGRNPINLALLKPGVRGGAGGSLNSFQPDSLSDGGFNINGSRTRREPGDHRRRHRHAHARGGRDHRRRQRRHRAGDPGPDRELHARIRPVLGRADPLRDQGRGPQLPRRPVRVHARRGHGRELVDAQAEPAPGSEEPTRALHLQPVRLRRRRSRLRPGQVQHRPRASSSSSGPRSGSTTTGRRSAPASCPRRRCGAATSASCSVHRTRTTGAPSRSTIRSPASPSRGTSSPPAGSAPTARACSTAIRSRPPASTCGATNWLGTSPRPSRTRKDTLRLDFAPNASELDLVPRLALQVQGHRCLLRDLRQRAPRLGPAQRHGVAELDEHVQVVLDQRGHRRHGARAGLHRDLAGHRHLRAQQIRDQLSVHLPREQAHPRQDPHHHRRRPLGDGRRPLSRLLRRTDLHRLRQPHPRARPPHLQGRRLHGVLRRRRHGPDQRERPARRHQQPERAIPVHGHARGRHGQRDRQYRARPVHELRRDRSQVAHGVARVRGGRLPAGLLEGEEQPDRRRRPALRLLAALARQAQQHRDVRSGVLQPRARRPRSTAARAPSSGGDRFNGIVLPGNGFPPEATGQIEAAGNPAYDRLFHGLPEGFSETHPFVFEPRLGMAYQINNKTVRPAGRRHLPPARPAQRLHAARRQPAHPVQGGRDQRASSTSRRERPTRPSRSS